jgi:hypothetical protein
MAATYITIQEAAELSGKSIQTIRRAIKVKKISSRRKKTPQGFNYSINKESVIKFYKIRIDLNDRKKGGLKRKGKALSKNYATIDDLRNIQEDMEDLISEQRKAKESFMRFMKTFQERFVLLENQLNLLDAPGEKKWFQFWK